MARFLSTPDAAQAVLVHLLLPDPARRVHRPGRRLRGHRHALARLVTRARPRRRRSCAALKDTLGAPGSTAAAISYYQSMLGTKPGDPALDAVQAAGNGPTPGPDALPARRRRRVHGRRARRRVRAAAALPRRPRPRDRPGERPLPPPRPARGRQPTGSSSSCDADPATPRTSVTVGAWRTTITRTPRLPTARTRAHRARVRALQIALAANGVFFGVQLVAGIAFGSLALIADSAHMASDVVALALALLAQALITRPASVRNTYGMQRAEVLAAQANAAASWSSSPAGSSTRRSSASRTRSRSTGSAWSSSACSASP